MAADDLKSRCEALAAIGDDAKPLEKQRGATLSFF
jgi:hypothetical protein